jgi:hypothetical protein
MSFGLGISFGRLCRRERSLEEVYTDAARIHGWEHKENPDLVFTNNPQLRATMIRSLSETFKTEDNFYEKV